MPASDMGLTKPTDHGSSNTWGATLNSDLDLIGEHTHETGKGLPVPSAGLKINADVAWSFSGTSYAITAMKALDFAPTAASGITSYASALFVNSSDSNNLYFRNESGTNVKITDGSTLNVSITGGIGGDYSTISALLDYDDATDTYRFRQETSASVRQYAKVRCADLSIQEYDAAGDATVPAEAVTLKSPDALAASYSLTFPAALPASTVNVRCSSTGALTFEDAHGSLELNIHISKFAGDSNAGGTFNSTGYISTFTGAGTVCAALELEVGKRILTYTQYYNVNSTGASITPKIRRMNLSTGVITDVAAGSADNTGAALESQTVSSINHTVLTGEAYFIEVTVANASHRVHGATVTYDDP